jgi:type IV secretory pathway protease TraF
MTKTSSKQGLIVLLLSLAAGTFLVASIALKPIPRLIWNASASVPTGPYFVQMQQPNLGEIAVIRPVDWVRLYTSSRGYLPENIWLLKPVFAIQGSLGCHTLKSDEVFVLARPQDSFDSRYFGPVNRSRIVGTAIPLIKSFE